RFSRVICSGPPGWLSMFRSRPTFRDPGEPERVDIVLEPCPPLIDRLPHTVMGFVSSKVSESLPLPKLMRRSLVTPENVTGPAEPLILVPSPVRVILPTLGWLMAISAPWLSPVTTKLPPKTAAVTFPASAMRVSSCSRSGVRRERVLAAEMSGTRMPSPNIGWKDLLNSRPSIAVAPLLIHANRKVFLNSGLREAPRIRRPFAFPVCGDLFEFLGKLPPAALLNPRIRTRHFRRPEESAASISWH